MDSISVDAACNSKTGRIEYQGVETQSGARLFRMGPFAGGSNNIDEFLAIVHALAWCKKHNIIRPIYTDSKTAMSWVRNKKARTRNPRIFLCVFFVSSVSLWLIYFSPQNTQNNNRLINRILCPSH